MATEEEVKPAKRGRGRPPKPESEKKAAKRKVCLGFSLGWEFSVLNFSCPILILQFCFFKAEPALDEDGNPVAKKGRGRPPGKNLIKNHYNDEYFSSW